MDSDDENDFLGSTFRPRGGAGLEAKPAKKRNSFQKALPAIHNPTEEVEQPNVEQQGTQPFNRDDRMLLGEEEDDGTVDVIPPQFLETQQPASGEDSPASQTSPKNADGKHSSKPLFDITEVPRSIAEENIDHVEQLMSKLNHVLDQTEVVHKALESLRNQAQLIKQSNDYERDVVSSLGAELYSLKAESTDLKKKMQTSRVLLTAELNEEIDEQLKRLQQLRVDHTDRDEELGRIDAAILVHEQQLRLNDATLAEEMSKKKRLAKLRSQQLQRGEAPTEEIAKQSVLTNEALVKLLTSVPSDEDVEKFMSRGLQDKPAESRQLRTMLGAFLEGQELVQGERDAKKQAKHDAKSSNPYASLLSGFHDVGSDISGIKGSPSPVLRSSPDDSLQMDQPHISHVVDDRRERSSWAKAQAQLRQDRNNASTCSGTSGIPQAAFTGAG